MPRIGITGFPQSGRQAEHLKNERHHFVVGQDEAIQQSNLMASGQIHRGDCIRVSHEDGSDALRFGREPETVQEWAVAGRAA